MRRDHGPFEPELEALLERGRAIRRLPDGVRARVLARAEASIPHQVPAEPATADSARARGLRVALAASVALLLGAAGAAAALYGGTAQRPEPAPPAGVRPTPAVRVLPPVAPQAVGTVAPHRVSSSRPQGSARTMTAQESYAAEVDVLQRAQRAYAGRDFIRALALVAEHAERFPSGRLAEEREALRVRSLAGAGRRAEARRAAAAFGERFPRSVLLPRIRETPVME